MNPTEVKNISIKFESNPPERKTQSVVVGSVCCTSCCCCCCCLFTVGSIVGAVVASGIAVKNSNILPNSAYKISNPQLMPNMPNPSNPNYPQPYQQPYQEPYQGQQGQQFVVKGQSVLSPEAQEKMLGDQKQSVKIALGIFWALNIVAFFLTGVSFLSNEEIFIFAILLLPLAQLIIGVLVIIMLKIIPTADPKAAISAIGKVLLGLVLGTLLGCFLMLIGFVAFL